MTGWPWLGDEPATARRRARLRQLPGLAVLAIAPWCFGERARTSERELVKRLLRDGCTLWGCRVQDTVAALHSDEGPDEIER